MAANKLEYIILASVADAKGGSPGAIRSTIERGMPSPAPPRFLLRHLE
jgi:hypothetical protein